MASDIEAPLLAARLTVTTDLIIVKLKFMIMTMIMILIMTMTMTMIVSREEWVSLPGGFTKTGSPLLVFPDKAQFNYLHVTDLHTLLQYYINVVPRSEQVDTIFMLFYC